MPAIDRNHTGREPFADELCRSGRNPELCKTGNIRAIPEQAVHSPLMCL